MTPILHRTVVFLNGVKGNGNSVVANTIAKVTGYTKIRPDDLLLDESVKETPRGMFIAEKMSKGEEIPEVIIIRAIFFRSVYLLHHRLLTIVNARQRSFERA